MKTITLTRGLVTTVEDGDYQLVSQFRWYALMSNGRPYAARSAKIGDKYVFQYLHRFLMNPPPGMVIDHIDGNTLNNVRSNLRICSRTENNRNRRPNKGSSSRFLGVSWDKKLGRWRVQMRIDGKEKYLGHYDSEEEAARVRDEFALKHHGQYARLNFPKT